MRFDSSHCAASSDYLIFPCLLGAPKVITPWTNPLGMALWTKGILPVCLFCLGFGIFFFFGFGLVSGDDDDAFPLFLALVLVVPSCSSTHFQ